MEIFEVGPCKSSYEMGYLSGERFSSLIKSRLATDLILQTQLRPYAKTHLAKPLIDSLTENNRSKFPHYWDELGGIAEGSGVPVLDVQDNEPGFALYACVIFSYCSRIALFWVAYEVFFFYCL